MFAQFFGEGAVWFVRSVHCCLEASANHLSVLQLQ